MTAFRLLHRLLPKAWCTSDHHAEKHYRYQGTHSLIRVSRLGIISKCQTHLCAWHSLHGRSLRLQNLGRSYHSEEQYLSVNHHHGETHSPRIYQPEGASSFRGTRSVQTSLMATCYVHPGRLHEAGLGYPAPKSICQQTWKDTRHLRRILSGRAKNRY